jgi:sugar-specific transcriptional regulator TrmB
MDELLVKKISKTGLTDKQSRIYAYLAEKGSGFPSSIARETKINRSTTYKILTELSIKGLITEIEKQNKLFYQVEKPEKLIKYTEDQIKLSEQNLKNSEKLFPELAGLYQYTPNKPRVRFFEGPDTVVRICAEIANCGKNFEMVAFTNPGKFRDVMPEKKLREFVKNKEKLNITTSGIAPDTKENRKYSEEVFKGINEKYWPKIKYIKPEKIPFEGELTIFNNFVTITKFTKDDIIGVIIEDEQIFKMMETLYRVAWESSMVTD